MPKKLIYVCVLLVSSANSIMASNIWTNTAGHAFHAELHQLTDTHASFVMQNGTTNRLSLTALSPASRRRARQEFGMPEIPAPLLPTFNLCRKDLLRIDDLYADKRLTRQERADARNKIIAGFRSMCWKHKLTPSSQAAVERRLLAGK